MLIQARASLQEPMQLVFLLLPQIAFARQLVWLVKGPLQFVDASFCVLEAVQEDHVSRQVHLRIVPTLEVVEVELGESHLEVAHGSLRLHFACMRRFVRDRLSPPPPQVDRCGHTWLLGEGPPQTPPLPPGFHPVRRSAAFVGRGLHAHLRTVETHVAALAIAHLP